MPKELKYCLSLVLVLALTSVSLLCFSAEKFSECRNLFFLSQRYKIKRCNGRAQTNRAFSQSICDIKVSTGSRLVAVMTLALVTNIALKATVKEILETIICCITVQRRAVLRLSTLTYWMLQTVFFFFFSATFEYLNNPKIFLLY